jgi:hypothetical protein
MASAFFCMAEIGRAEFDSNKNLVKFLCNLHLNTESIKVLPAYPMGKCSQNNES